MCSIFENILNLGNAVVEILCFVRAQYVNTFPTMSAPHFCFSNVHFSNWLAVLHRHFISSFTNFTFWRTLVQFFIKESKIVSFCRHEIYVQSCSLLGINSTAGQRSKNLIDPMIDMPFFCVTLFISIY